MQTVNLVQGSPEWLAFRATMKTASEAPAMMGESKYQTRDELLTIKKTGIAPEIDSATQRIFDNGHKFEALARPWAEEIIGEELYPATGFDEVAGMDLSASFDGITMLEDIAWEHKSLNDALRECLTNKTELPIMYRIQMEQQLIISGAEKCLFMASDGTKENMLYCWYKPDIELRKQIVTGWVQFETDLADFVPVEKEAVLVGKTIEALPSLIVQVSGSVATSNIDAFETQAKEFIDNINTDLQTDQDFADAEKMVKFCDQAEKQIKAVKQQSVESMADVSKVFRTMDAIAEELRQKRLNLEKTVKNEKVNKKNNIVTGAIDILNGYISSINNEFDYQYINGVPNNFAGVIKGKKTITSIQSAVNDELARIKIEVNDLAQKIRTNLKVFNDQASEYASLFNDLQYVIQKEPDDFALLVKSRIDTHKADEAEKKKKKDLEDAALKETEEVVTETVQGQPTATPKPTPIQPDPVIETQQEEVEAVASDEEMLRAYADEILGAISRTPPVEDEKLTKLVLRIQKKLKKAVEEITAKLPEQEAA